MIYLLDSIYYTKECSNQGFLALIKMLRLEKCNLDHESPWNTYISRNSVYKTVTFYDIIT